MNTITAVLEQGKDGYGVSYKEVPNVFGFGETLEQAQKDAYDALAFYANWCKDDNTPLPNILQDDYRLVYAFYDDKVENNVVLRAAAALRAAPSRKTKCA
jgi:predicted RNase H-like HicB family nuclease